MTFMREKRLEPGAAFLITYLCPGFLIPSIKCLILLNHRSVLYDPDNENHGRNFVLFAIVTDADDDVTAGSDGVEHM